MYTGRPFLVVEDDALVATSIARLIRNTARRPVIIASDAAQAVARLAERDDWCGLVLDVMLGSPSAGTGFDVLRFARERLPTVHALMLTGRLEHDVVNTAARLRASYVCKPAGLAELRPFIEAALSAEVLPDSKIAAAVEETLHRCDLHATRPAELLRYAVAGLSAAEIREKMAISQSSYERHVRVLRERTGERDLPSLVMAIARRAVRTASVRPPSG